MTTIAATASGSAGTVFIDDDGATVRFYISCSSGATYANGKSWSGVVNGVSVGGTFSFPAGTGTLLVAAYSVSYNQTVSFTMGATGTSGLGGPTTTSGAVLARSTVPSPPAAPTASLVTDTSMKLTWAIPGNGGATIDQMLLRRYNPGGGYTDFPQGGSVTSVVVTGMAARTNYDWYVFAHNSNGYSAASPVLSQPTSDLPDTPSLTFMSRTSTQIISALANGSYTGVGGITARETQISASPTFAAILATDTTTTPTFTGLTRNTLYYERGRVQDSVGWSAWTSTLVQTTDLEVPSTPTGYAAHDIAGTSAFSTLGTIIDNGGAPISAVNYQINTSASPTGATDVTLDSSREPLFTALTKNILYYYRLRVSNGGYYSAWGAWVSFTTLNNVPSLPTSFAVGAITAGGATFTWAAPADLAGSSITGYLIKIGSDKGVTTNVQSVTVGPGVLSQVFTGVPPNSTYYARVYALSSNGNGSTTPILPFTTLASGGTPHPIWENVAGTWKQVTEWENVAGVWKQITRWENVTGVWKSS